MSLKGIALVSIAVFLSTSGAANAGVPTFLLKSSVIRNAVIQSQRIMNGTIRVTTKIERKIASTIAREKSLGLPHEIPDIAVTKVSALYHEATPHILNELGNAKTAGPLTEQRVADIINTGVTKAIKNPVSEANWLPEFDILSGKLKLDWSLPTPVINLTVKEINIYKISATVASSVVACQVLDAPAFKECVEAALGTAKIMVAKELGSKSAHAAERPFGAKDEIAPE